jgi:GTPase SAR1 family protein
MKNIKVGDIRLKLQMWDTAGQDRFQTLTNTFFKGRPTSWQGLTAFFCYTQ